MLGEDQAEKILGLMADPRLEQIGGYIPPLSLFGMLDRTRDELTHSRMVAFLLSPRRHRQYESVLRALLGDVSIGLAQIKSSAADKFRRVAEAPISRVVVRREVFRIDIVVEVNSSAGSIVLGIENKIDAAEQEEQLARYQNSILHGYPNHTAAMVFLSPSARVSTTASQSSKVPCIAIGYRNILDALSAAIDVTEPDTKDWRVLKEIEQHLEEDILDNEDSEIRRLVGNLWKDHGRALDLALEHRPRLSDIRAKYEFLLREKLGGDAEFQYFPERGETREIKMQLGSWKRSGFPLTFMFFSGEDGPPWVRLLLFGREFNRRSNRFQSWARRVNASTGPELDESFSSKKGKPGGWRRVLLEENDPQHAILDDRSFDEETAREASQRVLALVELVRPYVELTD